MRPNVRAGAWSRVGTRHRRLGGAHNLQETRRRARRRAQRAAAAARRCGRRCRRRDHKAAGPHHRVDVQGVRRPPAEVPSRRPAGPCRRSLIRPPATAVAANSPAKSRPEAQPSSPSSLSRKVRDAPGSASVRRSDPSGCHTPGQPPGILGSLSTERGGTVERFDAQESAVESERLSATVGACARRHGNNDSGRKLIPTG